MATQADFREETRGLGLEDDCPVCSCSWPMCHGLCVAHTAMHGGPGPYHHCYNDDCDQCRQDEADELAQGPPGS